MKEIKAIIQPFMLVDVLHALEGIEALPGVTVSQIAGWGKSHARDAEEVTIEAGHRRPHPIRQPVRRQSNVTSERGHPAEEMPMKAIAAGTDVLRPPPRWIRRTRPTT